MERMQRSASRTIAMTTQRITYSARTRIIQGRRQLTLYACKSILARQSEPRSTRTLSGRAIIPKRRQMCHTTREINMAQRRQTPPIIDTSCFLIAPLPIRSSKRTKAVENRSRLGTLIARYQSRVYWTWISRSTFKAPWKLKDRPKARARCQVTIDLSLPRQRKVSSKRARSR